MGPSCGPIHFVCTAGARCVGLQLRMVSFMTIMRVKYAQARSPDLVDMETDDTRIHFGSIGMSILRLSFCVKLFRSIVTALQGNFFDVSILYCVNDTAFWNLILSN